MTRNSCKACAGSPPPIARVKNRKTRSKRRCAGANCGACGYAGCDGYAEALLTGEVKTNLCTPGGDPVARLVSEKLGLAYADVVEKIAVVRCVGDRDAATDLLVGITWRGLKGVGT